MNPDPPILLEVEAVDTKLPAAKIHSKVGAGAVGGAASVVVLWGIGLADVEIPLEVGAAITTLIAFAFGYIAKA